MSVWGDARPCHLTRALVDRSYWLLASLAAPTDLFTDIFASWQSHGTETGTKRDSKLGLNKRKKNTIEEKSLSKSSQYFFFSPIQIEVSCEIPALTIKQRG